MEDYRVQLEAYAGPLDLLLYLVKRHEIDLHDIPIAQLTDQYLRHLELIRQLSPALDMEQVGEFLVMAATLLEIKSQMIMPRAPEEAQDADAAAEAEDPADPRYELVQQLLAYKRYKDAARRLERQQASWSSRFAVHPISRPKPPRPAGDEAEDAQPVEIELDDVNVLDLCEAFSRILSSIGQTNQHEVTYDDTPISLHAEDIYDRLTREGPMTLNRMFEGRRNRSEMIGLFLATLELVRDHKVRVIQEQIGGEITLEVQPEEEQLHDRAEEATDWRDPETGEMQYDWPDEEAKRRAQRRERLRQKRREGGDFTASDEDLEDELDIEAEEADEEDDEPFE